MSEKPSDSTPSADTASESIEQQRTARIALLNDQLRVNGIGGQIMMTAGVQAQGDAFIQEAIGLLRTFSEFTEDNDPYGEHDFGLFALAGHKLYWKIDYYAKGEDGQPEYHYGSEDPSDPARTQRVLTLMLSEEY